MKSEHPERGHTLNRTKGEKIMLDDLIRRMIRAVVESFPIDETKKADMLQRIMGEKKKEEDK